MKFPIKDFFSKCDEIRRKLQCSVLTFLWEHKSASNNFNLTTYQGERGPQGSAGENGRDGQNVSYPETYLESSQHVRLRFLCENN